MKFKLLRRRLSISAPRMTVRTHVPWPLRALGLVAVLGLSAAAGMWIYDAGKRFAGLDGSGADTVRLREQLADVTAQRDRLQSAAGSVDSRLNIERSAQQQLVAQVRTLELNNAKLKEDLAFFESLSTRGTGAGLEIKRLQVEPDNLPNQMRYRILLTQGGKQDRDFSGNLQLVLTLLQGGKTVIMNLPGGPSEAEQRPYQVSFRLYQRIEGSFAIPADAVVKQVQARVLEHGAVRAQQTVVLK